MSVHVLLEVVDVVGDPEAQDAQQVAPAGVEEPEVLQEIRVEGRAIRTQLGTNKSRGGEPGGSQ